MPNRQAESQHRHVRDVFRVLKAGDPGALSAVTPAGFDWKCSLCPDEGFTPLQQVIDSGLNKVCNVETKDGWISVASWLLENGACPLQQASHKASDLTVVNCSGDEISLVTRGRSALSLAVELRDDMENGPYNWGMELHFLRDLIDLFKKHCPCTRADKVHINESVVDRWAWMLKDTSHHDVILSTADGARTAHSAMLMQASPVLKAALSSGMIEGQGKSVDVTDVPPAAVNIFLELVYTGSTYADVSADVALATLGLAHRWQVEDVVSMMENCSKSLLSPATFIDIACAAQLFELSSLKQACIEFSDSDAGLKEHLASRSDVPSTVLELLSRSNSRSRGPINPPKKRRTF